MSTPTWGNHRAIFRKAGFRVKNYPYWNAASRSVDFKKMIGALKWAPPKSLVLLHACAHNPTGSDPTPEQWEQIADVMQKRQLVPFLDCAYQGYASGSLEKDAEVIKLFEARGFEMFVAQSFAKNLGLYGERIGMLHVVCKDQKDAKAVLSQMKLVVRPMYSSPPIHGAQLVMKVLGNPGRFNQWKKELKAMADRIVEVRQTLRKGLERKQTPGTWNHITDQIGMFSYTGLTKDQCEQLIKEKHIYMLKNGRISLAGLNMGNIQYVVDAIDDVVKSSKVPMAS
jgi:aspartate aminotransferase